MGCIDKTFIYLWGLLGLKFVRGSQMPTERREVGIWLPLYLSYLFYPPEPERLVLRRGHDAPPVRGDSNAQDLRRRHIITKVQRTPQRTRAECPRSVATHLPVSTSQTLSVLSSDPDTTRRPSGNTAMLWTYDEARSSRKYSGRRNAPGSSALSASPRICRSRCSTP